MNVEKPCCLCIHLYVDALGKDDPNGYIECKVGHSIQRGNRKIKCPDFKQWERSKKK